MTVSVQGGGEFDGATLLGAATTALQEQIINAVKGVETATNRSGDKIADSNKGTLGKATDFLKDQATDVANVGKSALAASAAASQNLVTGQYEITDMTGALSDSFKSVGGDAGLLSGSLAAITSGADGAAKFLMETQGTFRQLSAVGAGLEGDLISLRQRAAETRLPLDQFASLVANNSEKLLALGGSIDEGTRRFSEFSKGVYDSAMGARLQSMGVGFEEANEFFADYLSTQRRNASFQRLSAREQRDAAQEYIYELDTLARITGKNRKELQEEARERARAGQNQAALRLLESQGVQGAQAEFESMSRTISSTMSPAFSDMAASMIRLEGTIDATDEQQRALAGAMPGVTETMSQASQAFRAGDFDEAQRLVEEAQAQYAERLNSPEMQELGALGGVAGPVGEVTAELFGSSQDFLDAVNRSKDAAGGLPDTVEGYRIAIDNMEAAAEDARQVTQEQPINQAVTAVETQIRTAGSELYRSINENLRPAIESGADAVTEAFQAFDVEDVREQVNSFAALFPNLARDIQGIESSLENADLSENGQENADRLLAELDQQRESFRQARSQEERLDVRNRIAQIAAQLESNVRQTNRENETGPAQSDVNLPERFTTSITELFNNIPSINAQGDINANSINVGEIPQYNDGTLGSTGSLMKDFGSGQLAMLHGKEAVLNMEQMQNLAKGVSVSAVREANSTTNLDQTVLTELQTTLRDLPNNIKSALNNQNNSESIAQTISTAMEGLASSLEGQKDIQRRQLKATESQSGDLYRGF
jgi:hypothetical protein